MNIANWTEQWNRPSVKWSRSSIDPVPVVRAKLIIIIIIVYCFCIYFVPSNECWNKYCINFYYDHSNVRSLFLYDPLSFQIKYLLELCTVPRQWRHDCGESVGYVPQKLCSRILIRVLSRIIGINLLIYLFIICCSNEKDVGCRCTELFRMLWEG